MADPIEEWLGKIHISDDQVAYFKEVLESNQDVYWTFCFTLAPPYFSPTIDTEKDPGDSPMIEALLKDRPVRRHLPPEYRRTHRHRPTAMR